MIVREYGDYRWRGFARDAVLADIVGRTLDDAVQVGDAIFIRAGGDWFVFAHERDCCERVYAVDVPRLSASTRGARILGAEERSGEGGFREGDGGDGTWTWTFYTVLTDREDFTLRWNGESNGYHSEGVSFDRWGGDEPSGTSLFEEAP